MSNKSWLQQTWKESGKVTYCEASRSKTYPTQSAKQLAKRAKGNGPVVVSSPDSVTSDAGAEIVREPNQTNG